MNIINLIEEELKMNNIDINKMENLIMNKTVFMLDMNKYNEEHRKLVRNIERSLIEYMLGVDIHEILVKYNDDVEYTIKLGINGDGVRRLVVLDEDGNQMFEPDWGRITGLLGRELAGIDGRGWN